MGHLGNYFVNGVFHLFRSAKLIEHRGDELVFVLPPNMRAKYEGLLTNLESESSRLGIRSYGMSDTTLEEIFLKVKNRRLTEFLGSAGKGLVCGRLRLTVSAPCRCI